MVWLRILRYRREVRRFDQLPGDGIDPAWSIPSMASAGAPPLSGIRGFRLWSASSHSFLSRQPVFRLVENGKAGFSSFPTYILGTSSL
jgi:hypothetical protein